MLLHIRVTGSAERSDGKGVEARLIAPKGGEGGTSIAPEREWPRRSTPGRDHEF